MRDAQHEHEKFEPALRHCLMDSDAEGLRLARHNRRRSLLLSTMIQTVALTAAVVLPLFASQTLPLIINDPPIPVPKSIRLVPIPLASDDPVHPPGPHKPRPEVFFQPIRIPTDIPPINDAGSQSASSSSTISEMPVGVPDGIPGLDPRLFSRDTRTAPAPVAPQPEPKPRGRIRISVIDPAKLLHKVEPVYPPLMKQIRKSGRVEFRAIIGKDGSIRELTLLSGEPGFVLAAQQAVLQWRYAPTLLNGEAVEVETRITVIFTMNP